MRTFDLVLLLTLITKKVVSVLHFVTTLLINTSSYLFHKNNVLYLHFIPSLDQSLSGSEAEEANNDKEEEEIFINLPAPICCAPAP